MESEKPLTSEVARRLVSIRTLLHDAQSDTRRPQPFNAAALAQLHDVAEQYLHLAATFKDADVEKKDNSFMSYWSTLLQVGVRVPYQREFRRLNNVRVGWKHHGVVPSHESISEARVLVEALIRDTVQQIFGIAFDEISVAQVIPFELVREQVMHAERCRSMGDDTEAAAYLAIAFDELLHLAGLDSSTNDSLSGRRVSDLVTSSTGSARSRARRKVRSHAGRLGDDGHPGVEALCDSIDEVIADLRRVASLLVSPLAGSDIGRFLEVTPTVVRLAADGVVSVRHASDDEMSIEDYEFCRNLIVELSLALGKATGTPQAGERSRRVVHRKFPIRPPAPSEADDGRPDAEALPTEVDLRVARELPGRLGEVAAETEGFASKVEALGPQGYLESMSHREGEALLPDEEAERLDAMPIDELEAELPEPEERSRCADQ